MTVKMQDLSDEVWREYEWITGENDDGDYECVTYRIENPIGLVVGTTTHRVLDTEGVVHCVPNVGHMGCVLRWYPRDIENPVAF